MYCSDEGVSCIEEPPDTPAHIFALRAFKTAIFGTPHPEQQVSRAKMPNIASSKQQEDNGRAVDTKEGHREAEDQKATQSHSEKDVIGPVVSPAKGILLTPGVGTSKRKNVSFMHFNTEEEEQDVAATIDRHLPSQDDSPTRRSHRRDQRPRPSSFTKTLLELSKQRASEHLDSQKSSPEPAKPLDSQLASNTQNDLKRIGPDQTVDLSQPQSRSGQHWKSEYEQYYHKSDREMKAIIRHSQNVKSFAVKKDSEAAILTEKLQRELARIESIEAKASRMANRLRIAQSQDTKGEGDHARLVSELAQQTALALKYKRKVDQYCKAIRKQSLAARSGDAGEESQTMPDPDEDLQGDLEQFASRRLVQSLQETARAAEERAQKIEAENDALKRSLARVKTEMMSYEARRQAREERLKKREERHKKARETAEAELMQLRDEHQNLRSKEHLGPTLQSHDASHLQSMNSKTPHSEQNGDQKSERSPPKENRAFTTSISPRKRRQQKAANDIWTLESPEDKKGRSPQPQTSESTTLPPSSVKNDISKALKELDLNLVSSYTPRGLAVPTKTKEPIGFEDGVPIFLSTSPAARAESSSRMPKSLLGTITSSPAKFQISAFRSDPSPRSRNSRSTVGRSASMLSNAGAKRASTMGGSNRTGSAMTAERAAAAKERLARRSAEKKMLVS